MRVILPHPNNGTAFSLIELLVTLAIASILLVLGLPAIQTTIERSKFKAHVSELHRATALARASASIRGVTTSLCPLDSSGKCSNDWSRQLTVFEDKDRNAMLNDGDVLIREYNKIDNSSESMHITRDFSRNAPIRFRSLGDAMGHNGTLKVCLKGYQELSATIIISRAGRIRRGEDKDGDGLVENSSGAPVKCV